MLQTPALLVADRFNLGFGVIPPVWTLSVETGLYLVVPLIAASFRHPFMGLAAAVAIVLGWSVLRPSRGLGRESVRHLAQLGRGAADRALLREPVPELGARLRLRDDGRLALCEAARSLSTPQLARGALWVTALTLPVFGAFVYLAGDGAVHDQNPFLGLYARQSDLIAIGYPLSQAALMLSIVLAPAWLQRPFAASPSRWLGDISYTIYLIHFAVIWFALREFSLPNDGDLGAVLAWSALVYPASIAYAYVSARLCRAADQALGAAIRKARAGTAETAPAGAG